MKNKILICTQATFETLRLGALVPTDSISQLHHLLLDLAPAASLDFPKFEIHVPESDLRDKFNGRLWNSFLAGQNDKASELPSLEWDLVVVVETRCESLHPIGTFTVKRD